MLLLGLFRIVKNLSKLYEKVSFSRMLASFLFIVFLVSTYLPTAVTFALDSSGATSVDQSGTAATSGNQQVAQDSSSTLQPLPVQQSSQAPATDEISRSSLQLGSLGVTTSSAVSNMHEAGLQSPGSSQYKSGEMLDKRTTTSTMTRNGDGTVTLRKYNESQFYKQGNDLQKIDTGLVEDKNSGDAGTIFTKALGTVESIVKSTNTYTVRSNDWVARFAPSDAQQGMVRIKKDEQQVGFTPRNAKSGVTPVVTTDQYGHQTVHYYDLWPGVNVEYDVKADELKESIVLKDKTASTDFAFTVIGAKLKKSATKTDTYKPLYDIDGALGNEFSVAPLAVSLNTFGIENAGTSLQQSYDNGVFKISLAQNYVQALPAQAFPLTIDPTYVHNNIFGSRAGGNYVSFKSDGYVCDSTICNPYAGAVLDSAGVWRYWRSMVHSDYSELRGMRLTSAYFHFTQRLGLTVSGTTDPRTLYTYHGTCFDINCRGLQGGSSVVGTSGDIDVTNIYQDRINAGDYGAWLQLSGEEGAYTSYKNVDPEYSYVSFTFLDVLPAPGITSPVNKQVYVDPQVSFTATPGLVNPSSGATLQYDFCISTGVGCAGAVMISGPQSGSQWTIPDGVLQNGTTYYAQARTYDPDPKLQLYGSYGSPVSFKIDDRTGKDSTQAYDTVGPVSADLATGNTATSMSSHTTSTLGGSIGVSLDYKSPMKSRRGLVGRYWNVGANYSGGTPTRAPDLTRVEQTVDFNWQTGSPSAGTVDSDWFYTSWDGYFVAPTTGTYYFGSKVDDVVTISINDSYVGNMPAQGNCYSSVCYGNGVTLQAGQVAKFNAIYREATGPAYAQIWVKGAVAEQVVPSDWLQTGPRTVDQSSGLIGRYYKDPNGTHDFTDSNNTLIMQRTDPLVSFNWLSSSAVPGGPVDKFMVRWTGYITIPDGGSYDLGTTSDDGSRITVGTNNTQVLNKWNDDSSADTRFGSAYTFQPNTRTFITVDYYENTGDAQMYLKIRPTGSSSSQVVPANWLSNDAGVLPSGWSMGIDADGNLSYDHLKATQSSVVLTDSTGGTHEYTWDASNTAKQGYKPPVNEDGTLVKNNDGTYTLQDSDGRTYVFNIDGTIASVTAASDDLKPAALKYVYGGTPSHLMEIDDGVDAARWGKAFYYGDQANCPGAIAGFDAPAAMTGKLCAFKTNDGRTTSLYYLSGNLSRVVKPGGETTDYQYDTLGRIVAIRDPLANDAVAAGLRSDTATTTDLQYDNLGRLQTVTAPAAKAGDTRQQQSFEYTQYSRPLTRYINTTATERYSTTASNPAGYVPEASLGSLLNSPESGTVALYSCLAGADEFTSLDPNCEGTTKVGLIGYALSAPIAGITTLPVYRCTMNTNADHFMTNSPTCDGQHVESLMGYTLSGSLPVGYTNEHIAGDAEPSGFSRRVKYDALFRTVADTDVTNQTTTSEWDQFKDLLYSTTDATGLKSTTIYDDDDRAISSYGPAPTAWFGSDRKPTASYVSQVPHTDTGYDETIQGTAVTYYAYGAASKTLSGAPKLHTTNLPGAAAGTFSQNFGATSPIPGVTDNWGFRATAKLRLPLTGSYQYRIVSDDGVKIYLDDTLQLDDWNTGATRSHPTVGYDNIANTLHRFQIEYFHTNDASSTDNANITLYITPPGGSETAVNLNQYLTPDYNLQTSQTVYGAPTSAGSASNLVSKTNYGSNPELGLAQSASTDANGLNLTATSTYEAAGATGSYLRQTSSTLPGGAKTSYTYYGATDVIANPCDTTKSYRQGGMLKLKTEPDPDGTGSQTPRTTETVYDDAGKVVATRYNSDPWTCTTYDSQERVLTTVVPSYNGQAGRTITNNYAVGGNPLITSSSDNTGTITVETDLLGRNVKYTDAKGNVTTSTYDTKGHLTGRVSPLGTEEFAYDNVDRLTTQKLDGTTYATVTYDTFSRISSIQYPSGQKLDLTRESTTAGLGRLIKRTYTLPTGQTTTSISDQVTRAVTGDITSGTELGQAKSYSYDTAGRLTAATVAGNTFTYGYGAQDNNCIGKAGVANDLTLAGKESNRTSYTVNGTTTLYCYDQADRLLASNNPLYSAVTYDSHGNTTNLGTSAATTTFTYDSSDRNIGIVQNSPSATGTNPTAISTGYTRDVQGRLASRTQATTANTGAGTVSGNWTSTDVGAPAVAGSTTYNSAVGTGGTYTVKGAGYDVWQNANTDDQFQFYYKSLTGDGSIVARLTSQTNTDSWAKAGVVIKASTTAGSNYASIHATPDNGYRMQWNFTNDVSGGSYTMPNTWMKLTRTGNTITTYKSSDGATWTQVGTTSITLPTTALIGLYVSSVNPTTLSTATFDNVTISTASTSQTVTTNQLYGYTASGDTPDFIKDTSGNVIEKYLTLPGDVMVTIRPSETDTNKKTTYSLPNIHGDIFATANASGVLTSTTQTGPFGEVLGSSTVNIPVGTGTSANNTNAPNNTVNGGSFAYVGQHEKLDEASYSITPIQMGARVYIPGLGRFLSVDPVQGGTPNSYMYALDPVNEFDLDGNSISWRKIGGIAATVGGIGAAVACGASIVCGIAAGAVAATASYTVKNAGTKQFSTTGLIKNAGVGGVIGATGGIFKVSGSLGKMAMNSRSIGTASKRFANPTIANAVGNAVKSGAWNSKGSLIRTGWSVQSTKRYTYPVFRTSIGYGRKAIHLNWKYGRFY